MLSYNRKKNHLDNKHTNRESWSICCQFFTLIVHTTLNTYVRDISDTHNKYQAFPIAIYVCVSIMMDIPLHLHAVRRTNYHCINSLWWVGQECLFTTSPSHIRSEWLTQAKFRKCIWFKLPNIHCINNYKLCYVVEVVPCFCKVRLHQIT